MLGLVIAGRYARDIEQTNPGRSFNEILRVSAAPAPVPSRVTPPVASQKLPVPLLRSASRVVPAQSASFAEVD